MTIDEKRKKKLDDFFNTLANVNGIVIRKEKGRKLKRRKHKENERTGGNRQRGRLTIYCLHLATSIFIASSGTIWRLLSEIRAPPWMRNRINTTLVPPDPVISLINIDRLINVESTRGTLCNYQQSIRSPTLGHEFIKRTPSIFSSMFARSFLQDSLYISNYFAQLQGFPIPTIFSRKDPRF